MLRLKINSWWVVAAAAIVLACNMGIRQTTGLMLPEISLDLNIPLAELSFGFGVQNLIWGVAAPIAGILAERYGTVRVLIVGGALYTAGLVIAALADSSGTFFIGNAILIGIGVGATTYPITLAAVARHFPTHKRTFALGVASAGGSMGQFIYAMIQSWTGPSLDWSGTFLLFAATTLLIFVVAGLLKDDPAERAKTGSAPVFNWQVLRDAFGNRDYQLLNLGFFVCGFHIALISVHMSGLVAYCGLPPEVASNSLALIGLANVAGVIAIGWAGDRWHKPRLLTLIYWFRACLIMTLLVMPASSELFYLFSVVMGVLWLSTVPPTSGTVADIFGNQNLASLFGFVMFSHQIGAFFGSWWGGLLFDHFGSYELALIISAALGLVAAAVHLPITPTRLNSYQPASA